MFVIVIFSILISTVTLSIHTLYHLSKQNTIYEHQLFVLYIYSRLLSNIHQNVAIINNTNIQELTAYLSY